MNLLPGWFGDHGLAASAPVDITHAANAVSGTRTNAFSFASQAFGAAASDRHLVACFTGGWDTNRTVSSVTIGGVSATVLSNIEATNSLTVDVVMAIAAVPTGTTGTVAITFGGNYDYCGMGLFRCTGLGNPATPTILTDITVTTNAYSTTSLTIPANGGAIGYVGIQGTSGARTFTWTNLTESFDQTILNDGSEFFGSHSGAISHTAGAAVRTATASGAIQCGGLICAAWSPVA